MSPKVTVSEWNWHILPKEKPCMAWCANTLKISFLSQMGTFWGICKQMGSCKHTFGSYEDTVNSQTENKGVCIHFIQYAHSL